MENYYSPKQAASMLDLTYAQVINRIRDGTIKAMKIGWAWAIPSSEVERLRDESQ